MQTPPAHLWLVDPGERLALRLGDSLLYYRRLSLGALAAAERQQTIWLPGRQGQPPQPVLPPAALEAALVGQVLLGWENVGDPKSGEPAEYSPQAAQRLPAAARALLLRRARRLHPWPQGGKP
jgi:hypothetical protein